METIADATPRNLGLARRSICPQLHPRAGRLCEGCRAAETGRNCWEVPISPCCDLARDDCDQCPVFAAAMRVKSQACRVVIHMEGDVVIEGDVHIQHPRRLSDTINDSDRLFLVVTDATLTFPCADPCRAQHHDMLMVLKSAARLILPVASTAA